MDSHPISLSLSPPPLERNPRTDNSLNHTMRFLDTYPRASFIFPLSFLHFLFFLRSLSPPSLFFPPKRGLHALHYWTSILLTRDRTHTPLSHPHSSSIFVKEAGRRGAYNWVQLGPVGLPASKDSSSPFPSGLKEKEIWAW